MHKNYSNLEVPVVCGKIFIACWAHDKSVEQSAAVTVPVSFTSPAHQLSSFRKSTRTELDEVDCLWFYELSLVISRP